MCGITGFIDFSRRSSPGYLEATVTRMADTLAHRGPDDGNVWFRADAGVALGHRRLSILDLSPHGRQPMHSRSGRYVIVFNGEIYNFKEIRKQLSDCVSVWRGHSDTEVMLAAIEAWGLTAAVTRFTGMFAFALWDNQDRCLHLVRDRVGEKPLYWGLVRDSLLFASELKAIRIHPSFSGAIDRSASALFFRHSCIPAPYTIYQGIRKLMPGTILTISADSPIPTVEALSPVRYWDALEVAEAGVTAPFAGGDRLAVQELDTLLSTVIRKQMISDVPLGVFLSGGIDSSTIAAVMQAQSSRPVKSFTLGFDDKTLSEAEDANAVARHLGTDHTEVIVTPAEAVEAIPRMASIYDEPFSDPSNVPTYLLSRLARQAVTVSLSGDGGDELFAGYNRHFRVERIWRCLKVIPSAVRRHMARLLLSIPVESWNQVLNWGQALLPRHIRERAPGERLHKLATIIAAGCPEEMYSGLVSHWQDPATFVSVDAEPATIINTRETWPEFRTFTEVMLYLDLVTYLPDDILVKVDRAGMGVSLETRMPYLDHNLIQFAWKLPLDMKIRNGRGKWLLRQVLYRYVPQVLVDRSKTGFVLPLGSWLRGPLRDWAEDLLDEKTLRADGFLDPAPVRAKWQEHLSGKVNHHYHLWDVLMFQSWLHSQ